jgi:hypothetical protein
MSHANPNLAIIVPPYRATSAKISQQRLRGFSTNLRNFLAHNKRKELTELLLKLSIYEFWGDDASQDFTPSGIAETIRPLGQSERIVGDDIAAAARELSERWGKGDMNPRLLTTPLTIPAAVDFAAPVPASKKAGLVLYSGTEGRPQARTIMGLVSVSVGNCSSCGSRTIKPFGLFNVDYTTPTSINCTTPFNSSPPDRNCTTPGKPPLPHEPNPTKFQVFYDNKQASYLLRGRGRIGSERRRSSDGSMEWVASVQVPSS